MIIISRNWKIYKSIILKYLIQHSRIRFVFHQTDQIIEAYDLDRISKSPEIIIAFRIIPAKIT